jgi:hypothetical protein
MAGFRLPVKRGQGLRRGAVSEDGRIARERSGRCANGTLAPSKPAGSERLVGLIGTDALLKATGLRVPG